jgi:uncharacterized protein YaaN involved in tellurite resistance
MADLEHRSDPAQPAGSDSSWAVDAVRARKIEATVADYVETAVSLEPGGQRFLRTVATIERLGQREFNAAAAMSTQMLERRIDSERGLLAARAPLGHQLAELRKLVDELDPAQLNLGGRRSRGPFRLGSPHNVFDELAGYFDRFADSRERIEAILATLAAGRLALERDNSLIGQERLSLATVMETLREQAYLAGRLDEALSARIDLLAQSDPERADCLRADLLHAIRRRRQEILTQLAVTMQGYASLQIVEEGNQGVILALATATTTTAAALRTAVMVAQAVAGQRMAIEQMEAAGAVAGAMAEDAGALVDRQSAAVREGLARASARVAVLKRSWDGVFAALDQVETEKERALQTISSAVPPAGSSGGG